MVISAPHAVPSVIKTPPFHLPNSFSQQFLVLRWGMGSEGREGPFVSAAAYSGGVNAFCFPPLLHTITSAGTTHSVRSEVAQMERICCLTSTVGGYSLRLFGSFCGLVQEPLPSCMLSISTKLRRMAQQTPCTPKNRRNTLAFPLLFRVNRCLLFSYPNAILPELEKSSFSPLHPSSTMRCICFPLAIFLLPSLSPKHVCGAICKYLPSPLCSFPPTLSIPRVPRNRHWTSPRKCCNLNLVHIWRIPPFPPFFFQGGYKDFHGAPYDPQSTFTVANQCLITCECMALRKRVPNWPFLLSLLVPPFASNSVGVHFGVCSFYGECI